MIAFSLFFIDLLQSAENDLLNENYQDKKLTVEMMAYQTDEFIAHDDDWIADHSYYQTSLIFNTELLNSAYMTYAEVFDEKLNPLSKQDNEFNPTDYPVFLLAIRDNNSGDIVLPYKLSDGTVRQMYTYYRWIPTGNYTDRFLVVVSISKEAIMTQSDIWFEITAGSLIFLTTILNIVLIMLIVKAQKTKNE